MNTPEMAEHIHDDDLTIYVRGGLNSEGLYALESHLSECEVCREALSSCVGVQLRLRYTGKRLDGQPRSEPRFETDDEASLQQLHPLSFERQAVKVVNVSRHGIGLIVAKPIYPGAIVQIRVGKSVELGEVRHCEDCGMDGYRVGLRLHSPS